MLCIPDRPIYMNGYTLRAHHGEFCYNTILSASLKLFACTSTFRSPHIRLRKCFHLYPCTFRFAQRSLRGILSAFDRTPCFLEMFWLLHYFTLCFLQAAFFAPGTGGCARVACFSEITLYPSIWSGTVLCSKKLSPFLCKCNAYSFW